MYDIIHPLWCLGPPRPGSSLVVGRPVARPLRAWKLRKSPVKGGKVLRFHSYGDDEGMDVPMAPRKIGGNVTRPGND